MALPSRTCQLSITAKDLLQSGKNITDQLQSLFRLPPEIRLRIYEYALGARVLHLESVYEADPTEPVRLCCHPCQYGLKDHPIAKAYFTSHDYHPDARLLPLLQSGRQIYIEAYRILYTSNIFSFWEPYTLSSPPLLFGPTHLASIRTLYFYYPIPHTRQLCIKPGYIRPWETLLSMPGLRNLRVKIFPIRFPKSAEFWTQDQGPWLAPLKRFEGRLKVFEVYLALARTAAWPKGVVDVGSCQLFAMDEDGLPYRDL